MPADAIVEDSEQVLFITRMATVVTRSGHQAPTSLIRTRGVALCDHRRQRREVRLPGMTPARPPVSRRTTPHRRDASEAVVALTSWDPWCGSPSRSGRRPPAAARRRSAGPPTSWGAINTAPGSDRVGAVPCSNPTDAWNRSNTTRSGWHRGRVVPAGVLVHRGDGPHHRPLHATHVQGPDMVLRRHGAGPVPEARRSGRSRRPGRLGPSRRVGLIYPDEVRTVEETARSLLTLVEHRVEPFGHAALAWLDVLRHAPR